MYSYAYGNMKVSLYFLVQVPQGDNDIFIVEEQIFASVLKESAQSQEMRFDIIYMQRQDFMHQL